MNDCCILPIVEGHGEVEAIRLLLCRVWGELLGGNYVHVLKPLRVSKGRMTKNDELHRYLKLAELKLGQAMGQQVRVIMILVDADDDLPCVLSKKILDVVSDFGLRVPLFCVVANKEFETWFVASADVMSGEFKEVDDEAVMSVEENGRGKGWVKEHLVGHYSETADMPRLASKMDLERVRKRCPSFDKLCRELEKIRNQL